MPKFNLYAGLTGGFNSVKLVEENVECESLEEAEMFAYDYALSEFDKVSGTHGLRSYIDIENELKEDYDDDDIEFDDIVLEEYLQYADRWIGYYVKEVDNG